MSKRPLPQAHRMERGPRRARRVGLRVPIGGLSLAAALGLVSAAPAHAAVAGDPPLADWCVALDEQWGRFSFNRYAVAINYCDHPVRVKIVTGRLAPDSDCRTLAPGKDMWHPIPHWASIDRVENC